MSVYYDVGFVLRVLYGLYDLKFLIILLGRFNNYFYLVDEIIKV